MPQDDKYGQITVENEPDGAFAKDEPVFLIRAKDVTAEAVIEYAKGMAMVHHASEEHVAGLDAQLEKFKRWREDNRESVKVPD